MAVIDRPTMLADLILYLPQENVLSDELLLTLIENVILKVGYDDDAYYSEILCKALNAAGHLNKSQATISGGSVKREKSHGREVEWFADTGAFAWDRFLDSLPDVCLWLPGGGYEVRSAKSYGFYGNVADAVNVPECSPPYGELDED